MPNGSNMRPCYEVAGRDQKQAGPDEAESKGRIAPEKPAIGAHRGYLLPRCAGPGAQNEKPDFISMERY